MHCIVGASMSELCGILVLHRHVITATHNILHVCNVCTNSCSGSQGRAPSLISLPALCCLSQLSLPCIELFSFSPGSQPVFLVLLWFWCSSGSIQSNYVHYKQQNNSKLNRKVTIKASRCACVVKIAYVACIHVQWTYNVYTIHIYIHQKIFRQPTYLVWTSLTLTPN